MKWAKGCDRPGVGWTVLWARGLGRRHERKCMGGKEDAFEGDADEPKCLGSMESISNTQTQSTSNTNSKTSGSGQQSLR